MEFMTRVPSAAAAVVAAERVGVAASPAGGGRVEVGDNNIILLCDHYCPTTCHQCLIIFVTFFNLVMR